LLSAWARTTQNCNSARTNGYGMALATSRKPQIITSDDTAKWRQVDVTQVTSARKKSY